jgi:hypothetical protein
LHPQRQRTITPLKRGVNESRAVAARNSVLHPRLRD